MRKNLVFTPLMVILAAGSSVSSAYGQDLTSAVMAGRVTSNDGRPLRSVRVLVNSPALLAQRETATDANGQFRLPILPSGQYTVTYTLDGYITRRLTVILVAGQVGNANASMTPINAQEATVEIIGATTQIDKTDTVVQTSFTNEQMNKLMKPGDYINAHALVPGVGGGQLGGTINIRGGTNRSTKVIHNGTIASELFGGYMWSEGEQEGSMFLEDMIESFAVLLSPSNARYGNSDGGMVSIVSKKGGNEFKGSFRAINVRRDFWGAREQQYIRRDGTYNPSATRATGDQLNRRYEFTLEGPLWKDRVSFAYGGAILPPIESDWVPGGITSRWISTRPEPFRANVGTFYQNGYGDIIRKSELGAFSNPDAMFKNWKEVTNNQFVIYGQITPNHQVEFLYKESTVSNNDPPTWYNIEPEASQILYEPAKDTSFAYKGVIGSSGVLDFRYSTRSFYTELPTAGQPLVWIRQIPSYVPYNGGFNAMGNSSDYNNFDNYFANGIVHAAFYDGIGGANYGFMGMPNDFRDGGITTSITLNYQHHLNAKGSHLIDVGFQSDKLDWETKLNDSTRYTYYVPGRIAIDLTEADVYRAPGGPQIGTQGRLAASDMAGRFIVWNMRNATLRTIDPYGAQWAIDNRGLPPSLADTLLSTSPIWGIGGQNIGDYYPRLRERTGNESGEYTTGMQSFYINDLWTLNDYHSVMLGLRLDMYKVSQTRDLISYTQPTFRFDYKWDIKGDQSRLVNVSLNQYHNMINAGTFMPFVEARLGNLTDRYWDAGTGGGPQLVTLEQLLDRSNYGLVYAQDVRGAFGYQIDPDWKNATSTEFGLSFARNFSGGGTFKISYVQRSFANLHDMYPGEPTTLPDGSTQLLRVLRNTDDFERSYKGVEVEWNIPLTKRLDFGGFYSHSRLMHNQTGVGTTNTDLRTGSVTYQMPEYWDQFWPRETWAPVLLNNPEHTFSWWFVYDLTSGKTQSSLSLRGRYYSGGYGYRTITELVGVPEVPGFTSAGYWNQNFVNNVGRGKSIIYGKSKGDDTLENVMLRYNLTVPMVRKLSWFLTVEMWSPFNHRGRTPSGLTGFGMPSNRILRDYVEPGLNGQTLVKNDLYPNGPYPLGNFGLNDLYANRQTGRGVTMQTGLRF